MDGIDGAMVTGHHPAARTLPGRRDTPGSHGQAASAARERPPGVPAASGRTAALLWVLPLPLVLLLALPLLALAWRAIAASGSLTPQTWAALRQAMALSLATSALSLVLIVAFGTPLAFALARRRFPGSRALNVLIDLPIVLPPSVAGIALLLAFGRFGLVGRPLESLGITVGFTTAAVVLAQTFVAAPFFVRAAIGAFARIDRDLEEAAADLGSGPWRTLLRVTLPLALPALAAGAVLAWARALGEFGATIMFAGNFPGVTRTMPLAIYSAFGGGDLETAILLAAALLLASGLTLGIVRAVGGRER